MKTKKIAGIKGARLRGQSGLLDVRFDESGRIEALGPSLRFEEDRTVVDAAGGLVLPSFVDPHLHLDLAYSRSLVKPNVSGTLVEAIRHWTTAKKKLTPENVCERAVRAIHAEVGFGTGHIRTHVDVASNAGLRLVEGVLAAREACRDIVDIQIVVFPQDGLIRDSGAMGLMIEAMQMGCDIVGGIAHNERTMYDSFEHLDMMFKVADADGADIDCHIDETDDPHSICTEYLAQMTIDARRQGHVTASHVCALGSYDDAHAAKVIGLLREARMCVVTNPGVNLHLQGRHDRYPKRRGLTRVSELLDAGVTVAAGQDCIEDPFYPFGTGQMLDVAHMLAHADHMTTRKRLGQVLDAVTTSAASVMGLDGYGVKAGAWGDLVILPVADGREAIRLRPRPSHVVKRGRLIELA